LQTLVVARGLSGAAIYDKLLRSFSYFRIKIIKQHAEGRLLLPAQAMQGCAAWSAS
jgi:hypothetical protein